MDVVYKLTEYAASLFDATAAIIFLTVVLGRKSSKPVFYIIATFSAVTLSFLQDVSSNSLFTLLGIFLFNFLFEILFLQGKWGVKLFYDIIFHSVLLLSNMVTVYGLTAFLKVEVDVLLVIGSKMRLMTLIIHKIVFVFILLFVILFQKRKQFSYQEWLMGSLMFAGTLLTGCVIANLTKTGHLSDREEAQLIFVTFGLLAICTAIGICMYRLNCQHQYKLENQVLTTKLQEEKYMLQKTEEMYKDNCILRHDLKHYLTVAQGMMHAEGIEKTSVYLEELIHTKFDSNQIFHTDSSVVNAVLNDKIDICRKNGIPYEVKISGLIGEENQIDIGIILSNLIDNAIEAELHEKQKQITIEITRHKKTLLIKVENTICQSVLSANPNLRTMKKDKINHGIGLKSVRKIVQELDGVYLCEEEENTFIVRIILPENANRAK
ncbi:MAG: sensor histidine kinase [Lachnospiraceae bacterium]